MEHLVPDATIIPALCSYDQSESSFRSLLSKRTVFSRQDDLCVPDEAGAAAHNPLDAPEPQHLRAHHPRQVLHHAPAHRPRHLAQADVALVTQSHLFILQSSFFSHRNENIFIFRVCFVSDSQTLDSVVNLINCKIMPPSILILKTVCLVIITRLIDVGDGSLLVWAVPLPEDGGQGHQARHLSLPHPGGQRGAPNFLLESQF